MPRMERERPAVRTETEGGKGEGKREITNYTDSDIVSYQLIGNLNWERLPPCKKKWRHVYDQASRAV